MTEPRAREVDSLPSQVVLRSEDLLSKWGFADGDLLDDASWALAQDEGLDIDEHALLIELVRTRLVPALEQSVELVEIGTIHNPVRASRVNGRHVEDLWYEVDVAEILTPPFVEVPMGDVLQLARKRARSRPRDVTPRAIGPGAS